MYTVSPRAKATRWRDVMPRMIDERHRLWARRRGFTLTVVVARRSGVGLQAEACVHGARVETMRWPMPYLSPRILRATIALAQRWAEKQADELAVER